MNFEISNILWGILSIVIIIALRAVYLNGKKNGIDAVTKKNKDDLDKFVLFTMELVFRLHANSLNENVPNTLMKFRTYEVRNMVLNRLKNFDIDPGGPNFSKSGLENEEILMEINEMLSNIDLCADEYQKSRKTDRKQ